MHFQTAMQWVNEVYATIIKLYVHIIMYILLYTYLYVENFSAVVVVAILGDFILLKMVERRGCVSVAAYLVCCILVVCIG